MSHTKINQDPTDGLCCFSSAALAILVGARVGAVMLGSASGAGRSMGGPAHAHATLAALSYSDRQTDIALL